MPAKGEAGKGGRSATCLVCSDILSTSGSHQSWSVDGGYKHTHREGPCSLGSWEAPTQPTCILQGGGGEQEVANGVAQRTPSNDINQVEARGVLALGLHEGGRLLQAVEEGVACRQAAAEQICWASARESAFLRCYKSTIHLWCSAWETKGNAIYIQAME